MKLSTEIATGLKKASNSSLISNETFQLLIKELSSFAGHPVPSPYTVGIAGNTPRVEVLKQILAALLCFVVEAVRWNEDSETVRRTLTDFDIPTERIDAILHVIGERKSDLRSSLRLFNSDPRHVFDVNWKLHYCVKSMYSDYDGTALYFIEFSTRNRENARHTNNVGEKLKFVCTVDQLQSLVASLKSAVRQLESVAGISS